MEGLTKYAGRVGARAAYRPANGIGALEFTPPEALGIAHYALDLASLRGLDAHRAAESELVTRMEEIDREAEGRAFSDAQRAEFTEIADPETGQLAQVRSAIGELEVRERAIGAAIQAGDRHVETPSSGFNAPTVIRTPDNIFDLSAYRQRASGDTDKLPGLYRDGAMRVIEQAVFPTAEDQNKVRGHVAKLIDKHSKDLGEGHGAGPGHLSRRVIETGSPLYAEAWANYISRRPLTARMQAALQTYTDADGGFAVPVTIDPTFINTSDGSVNPLRTIARVETITTKSWQAVTTAGVTASYVGERTTTGAADGAPSDVDNPTITPLRADVAVDVTLEYQADYPGAIAAEVGSMIQIAKDDLEADKFVMGAGTTEPDGVVTALITDTTSIVLTATDNVFALGDIDLVISQTPPRFRSRGRFMANLSILQLAPAFGTAGQPGNSIYDAYASTLRGKPVHEATAMDDVATDAKEILLFGDFKAGFAIIDRLGLTTRVLDARDTNGRPTGNTVIYAAWRNSSNLLFANAFRLLKVR